MEYHSHVLYFPKSSPFDRPAERWPSFLGCFVTQLVLKRPELVYWFSFYGSLARFRVYTSKYESIRKDLEPLRDRLGLIDKGEEKNLTLVEDLGGTRFLPPARRDKKPEDRALFVLNYLHSVCRLHLDYLQQRSDGYFQLEQNPDPENPDGHPWQSPHHLLCNIGQPVLPIHLSVQSPWMESPVVSRLAVRF